MHHFVSLYLYIYIFDCMLLLIILADIAHCLQIADPKLIFCDKELEENVEKALEFSNLKEVEIIVYGETSRNIPFSGYLMGSEKTENSFQVHKVTDFYSPACIMYSSGTTGLPKGVCCTHLGLLTAGFAYKGLVHHLLYFIYPNNDLLICTVNIKTENQSF